MARRRFQAPRPLRRGRWWYLLYWQDVFESGRRIRKRKRIKIGPGTLPEREAKKIAAEHLRPLNQGLESLGSVTKFDDYIREVYRPVIMPLLASTTQSRYESVIKVHLSPAFGGCSLREMTAMMIQKFLSGLSASNLSHQSCDKIRDVLSSILSSATEYGLLVKNPVGGLRIPPPKRGLRTKPYLTPVQFTALVRLMREPYASMIFVAVYTGLRVSELAALRWRNVHVDSITIDERFCRGDWSAPKSAASNATIAVHPMVIVRINRLRNLVIEVRAGRAVRRYPAVRSSGPDDLVFQSSVASSPICASNVLSRHIKPAARKAGMAWVNWLVLRRSFATWLKMAGADIKDAQALMRHSRASTTLDHYQQFVTESQRRAVANLGELGAVGLR